MIRPEGYKKLTKEEKLRICNGTGAKGTPKIITKLLDNFFGWGVDFSKASNIHDYCYYAWKGWLMKILADILYFVNMVIICFKMVFKKPFSNAIGSIVLLPARLIRAFVFFNAVLFFGWKAFKNN